MANEVATQQQNAPRVPSILTGMAQTYGVTVAELDETIRNTVMDPKSTYAEYLSFLAVAKVYNLNPMTREIFAFPKKHGGIVPLVSIDGWIRIVTTHPEYAGHKWEEQMSDDGKQLISCTCIMFRKGRDMPTVVTEYFVECKQDTLPWRNMPHRMLRHKAFIQAARYCFGFSGIYDEDEGRAMGEDEPRRSNRGQAPKPPSTLVPHDPTTGEVIDAEARDITHENDGSFGGPASQENADGDGAGAVKEPDPAPPVEAKKAEVKKETPKPASTKADPKPTPFEELKAMLEAAQTLKDLVAVVAKDAKGKPAPGMKLYDKLTPEEVDAMKPIYAALKAKFDPKPDSAQEQQQTDVGDQQDGGEAEQPYNGAEALERIGASYDQCDSIDSLEACQFSLEETLDTLNRGDREKAQGLYEAAEKRIKAADAAEAGGAAEQQEEQQDQAEAAKDPATMTIDEYMAYAEGYIRAATEIKPLNTLWFGEAGIRTETLKLPEKLRDQLRDLRNAKLNELRAAAG